VGTDSVRRSTDIEPTYTVELTQAELALLVELLNKVPWNGLDAARKGIELVEKLASAAPTSSANLHLA